MATLVTMTGASGSQYSYEVCTFAGDWNPVAGNYAFARYKGDGQYQIIYFGESANLCDRMANHDRWREAVVRHRADYVLARVSSAAAEARLAEEQDLIRFYNPPLNVHERKPAVAGFAPGLLGRRASLLGGE